MNTPSNTGDAESISATVPQSDSPTPKENDRTILPFGLDDNGLGDNPQSILTYPVYGADRVDINLPLQDVLKGTNDDFRVFDVIVELLAGYSVFPDTAGDKWWTFLNFGLTDPFDSDGPYSSEVVALAHYPAAKAIKARVFFTFTEHSHFGRYGLDRLTKDQLLRWANFKLDTAIHSMEREFWMREHHPRWFIHRGRVASIEVEPNKMAHRAYLKGREVEMFSELED